MIIDIHMHLGDILHNNGGEIIGSLNKYPKKFTIQKFEERILHFNSFWWSKKLFAAFDDNYTISVQKRLQAGTIKNYNRHLSFLKKCSYELFGDNNVYCAGMPVAPYVTYENLAKYASEQTSLLPFTSINPNLSINENCDAFNTVAEYAYGLKLHPIIQGIPFNSALVYAIMDLILVKRYKMPILFHAGASRYYIGTEKIKQHCELDNISDALEMVARYPQINFIIGHAGIAEMDGWATALSRYENVYVDVTVQPIVNIKKLINIYGEDRVLFATDWPAVDDKTTMRNVLKSITFNQREKVFYKNAKKLLKDI